MTSEEVQGTTWCGDVLQIPRLFGCYEYLETIGAGGYSVVVRIRDRPRRVVYAAKVMRRPEPNSEDMRTVESELRLCETLSCSYLVKCREVVYLENVIIVVMECFGARNLLNAIIESPDEVTKNWRDIFRRICLGVEYLHERGLAHRDLKPENALVTDCFECKLCDYGLLCEIKGSKRSMVKCGTLAYMSPETIKGDCCGQRSDIWALGIVVYVMATGCVPWKGETEEEIVSEIERGIECVDLEMLTLDQKEIVMTCCDKNPETRPGIADILALGVVRGGTHMVKAATMQVSEKGRVLGSRVSSLVPRMGGPSRTSGIRPRGIRPSGSLLRYESMAREARGPRGPIATRQRRLSGSVYSLTSGSDDTCESPASRGARL